MKNKQSTIALSSPLLDISQRTNQNDRTVNTPDLARPT